MGRIFNMDNAFFRGINKIVDCIIVSTLWLIFCIPIFTIGASTSALYYAVHRTLKRGKGYIASSFWEGFKSNFKRSTLLWLIQGLITLFLLFDLWITYQWLQIGYKWGGLFIVFVIVFLYLMVWLVYTYCYAARFDNTIKNTLKNAAIFQLVHLPWSLLILALLIVSALMIYFIPLLMFVFPGAVFACYELFLEKLFRKYMTEEDLAKEEEDDRYDQF